jgi:para-nitrobenzyl esterase
LFHRAIIESGATLRLVEPDQATRVADRLLDTLGLDRSRVRELQDLPMERIMGAYFSVVRSLAGDPMTMGFAPVVDGVAIPRHPFSPDASDVSGDVPLIIGSTRTEMTSSADTALFDLDEAGLRERIDALLGEDAEGVLRVYREANPGATASDLYFLISSDHSYGAPVMKIAERRAALGEGPVYLYYFRWESPFEGGRRKSPHTVEIPFVFHNIEASPLTKGSPRAPALAAAVSDAWVSFARTGDPNTARLPEWPKFDATRRPTMVFDDESRVEDDPIRDERIAMFNAMADDF